MKPSQFITAKELAPHLEMDVRKLFRREVQLGLVECRDPASDCPIRWFKNKAVKVLTEQGYIILMD